MEVTGRGSAQARADFIIWRTPQDKSAQNSPLLGLLGMFTPLHYRASALFEIIPARFRFEEGRRLIDAGARASGLGDLAGLTGFSVPDA